MSVYFETIRNYVSFRELKKANESFSESPRNQMSYQSAENVDRVLL